MILSFILWVNVFMLVFLIILLYFFFFLHFPVVKRNLYAPVTANNVVRLIPTSSHTVRNCPNPSRFMKSSVNMGKLKYHFEASLQYSCSLSLHFFFEHFYIFSTLKSVLYSRLFTKPVS